MTGGHAETLEGVEGGQKEKVLINQIVAVGEGEALESRGERHQRG